MKRDTNKYGPDGLPGPFEREVMFGKITHGCTVEIETPHGGILKGWAVMRGPAGWVLNCGGPHGTPKIASDTNTVSVTPPRCQKPMVVVTRRKVQSGWTFS